MVRYGLGSNSYLMWADEPTPYTVAVAINKNFGLIGDDFTPPNPNKKTALPSIGSRRAPHVWANEPNEYAFDVNFAVQHTDAPFHAALGVKTVTTVAETGVGLGNGYTKTLFTESSILPTISLEHGQSDISLLQRFIGTKASLGLSCSKSESLKASMGFMAAKETHLTGAPAIAALQVPSIPTTEPFRFSHIQYAKLFQPGTQTLIKDVATLDSFDFNWNPGLESVPHGGTSRQNYTVVEGDPAGLYDMKIGVTVADTDFFLRAADNAGLFDLEVALARTVGAASVLTDACIIRLKNCTVLEAPNPAPAAGRIKTDIPLGPLSTEIELRAP